MVNQKNKKLNHMKKLFSTLAVVALSALSLNAQVKEGSVTYTMKIEGLPPEQAAMMGDMETKVTFKNDRVLTDVSSMMGSQVFYTDAKGMLMLIDQMGNKIAVKQTKEEMDKAAAKEKDKQADPKIEYTAETKMIAGYECKKAIVTTTKKDKTEEKVDVWYCEKFDNPNKEGKGRGQAIMKGLKGMAFEYSGGNGGMKFKMVAKEVSMEPVADSKFELSTEGYKMMTMDEVKAMQGGR
jgi:GLPGLI family protein